MKLEKPWHLCYYCAILGMISEESIKIMLKTPLKTYLYIICIEKAYAVFLQLHVPMRSVPTGHFTLHSCKIFFHRNVKTLGFRNYFHIEICQVLSIMVVVNQLQPSMMTKVINPVSKIVDREKIIVRGAVYRPLRLIIPLFICYFISTFHCFDQME